MLDELSVQNIALIKQARILPTQGPGLCAITGETGSGKTALLSSLKLALGERADASWVREGEKSAEVDARFYRLGDVPEDAQELERTLYSEDGCVVKRRLSVDGRSRVELDGSMSSVKELQAHIGPLVDLCGQHEHQRLLNSSTHLEMLDTYMGEALSGVKEAYEKALVSAKAAAEELARIEKLAAASDAKLDEAAFIVRKCDEVGLVKGEYEELEEQLPRLMNGEILRQGAAGAHESLHEDGSALDCLADAVASLKHAQSYDQKLKDLSERLDSALIDIEDIDSELVGYIHSLDVDEDELERVQERLGKLDGLKRSYGPSIQDVFDHYAAAQEVLAAHSGADELLNRARDEVRVCEAELKKAAGALEAARKKAAPKLAAAITKEMAALEMAGASVSFESEALPHEKWTRAGSAAWEIMYRPGQDMSYRPLKRIASGGEVSRVMLAIKVVLGERDDCDTLVFDEVDAGVGGATAVSLAQVLERLGKTHQVLVVTHLAQVAARADMHYVVSKTQDGAPETEIREVTGDGRIAEIARMLSGDTSEVSLAHARELLHR